MITPSASTLGAPGTPLPVVLRWLKDVQFPGIELRLAPGEAADPNLDRQAREALREAIEAAGFKVTSIASYVQVAAAGKDETVILELIQALDFARDLGAPMVRVFPGAATAHAPFTTAPALLEPADVVDERAARRLTSVSAYADVVAVLPVLETHDSHPTGADIARILARVQGTVGVVWDLLHPWRVGEALEDTWNSLRPWFSTGRGTVQVKDAALPEGTPELLGGGNLPLNDFAELLINEKYQGTVTLEWEKAWYPQVPQLDLALKSTRTWLDLHWRGEEK